MAAAVAARLLQRGRPDAPVRTGWTVPEQLDRNDFEQPDVSWLVAVFTSATCDSCKSVLATAAPPGQCGRRRSGGGGRNPPGDPRSVCRRRRSHGAHRRHPRRGTRPPHGSGQRHSSLGLVGRAPGSGIHARRLQRRFLNHSSAIKLLRLALQDRSSVAGSGPGFGPGDRHCERGSRSHIRPVVDGGDDRHR